MRRRSISQLSASFSRYKSLVNMFFFNSMPSLLLILGAGAGLVHALPTSNIEQRAASTCPRTIDGVGTFTNSAIYTFTGSSLPAGLHISNGENVTDRNHGAPYNHVFLASNVAIGDGYLQIKVPGGQNPGASSNYDISSGQVFTDDAGILYASVRTRAVFSKVPGTVQSTFFYKSDTQEIDIEYLSAPNSQANTGGQASIHFTNQPTNGGSSTTSLTAAPVNIDTAEHEYRIDWTKDYTAFYFDGVLKQKYTVNVPSTPGTWLWNNWSNGDKMWSAGPPAKDSVMKVRSIEMYYNTTSGATNCS